MSVQDLAKQCLGMGSLPIHQGTEVALVFVATGGEDSEGRLTGPIRWWVEQECRRRGESPSWECFPGGKWTFDARKWVSGGSEWQQGYTVWGVSDEGSGTALEVALRAMLHLQREAKEERA